MCRCGGADGRSGSADGTGCGSERPTVTGPVRAAERESDAEIRTGPYPGRANYPSSEEKHHSEVWLLRRIGPLHTNVCNSGSVLGCDGVNKGFHNGS